MLEKNSTAKAKASSAKPVTSTLKRVTAKPSTAAKPVKKEKKEKKVNGKVEIKVKVIRDSFTMPQDDYVKISELKQKCQKAGLQVKKSELLRAGLQVLSKLNAMQLKQAIAKIEQIKTGRPKKT
jgi:hypothetical protein